MSSLTASTYVENTNFVELHVQNSEREHDVVNVVNPLSLRGMNEVEARRFADVARRLAKCMTKLVKQAKEPAKRGKTKEARQEKKRLDEVHDFQQLVQEALDLVVEQKLASVALSATVEVRQGSATSTPTINFTRCNMKSNIDVSVVISTTNSASVIGVCEVKKQAESIKSAINQQLCTTLTKQRSVHRKADGKWLLPGLVVYADKAFITMMETGDWWHYTAELKFVQLFNLGPVRTTWTLFGQPNLDCAYKLLAVLSDYTNHLFGNHFTVESVFCDAMQLSYFTPPGTQSLHSSHIVRCKYGTVKMQLPDKGHGGEWRTRERMSDDDDVVVKTFTIGLYGHAEKATDRLAKLLLDMREAVMVARMQQLELNTGNASAAVPASENSLADFFSETLKLHVWIGRMADSKSRAIVTRFVGDRVYMNSAVLELWKTGATRKRFYEQICDPALKLVAQGYFHGDIRPPNVVARVVGQCVQFTLIDWDDVRTTDQIRSIQKKKKKKGADGVETEVVAADNRYPALSHVTNDAERSMLFTVCQLYVTAIIIDRVAHSGEDALELEVHEWKKKDNFWHKPDRLDHRRKIHFWAAHRSADAQQTKKKRETHFDQLVDAMQTDAKAESRSAEHLTAILKAALQI